MHHLVLYTSLRMASVGPLMVVRTAHLEHLLALRCCWFACLDNLWVLKMALFTGKSLTFSPENSCPEAPVVTKCLWARWMARDGSWHFELSKSTIASFALVFLYGYFRLSRPTATIMTMNSWIIFLCWAPAKQDFAGWVPSHNKLIFLL